MIRATAISPMIISPFMIIGAPFMIRATTTTTSGDRGRTAMTSMTTTSTIATMLRPPIVETWKLEAQSLPKTEAVRRLPDGELDVAVVDVLQPVRRLPDDDLDVLVDVLDHVRRPDVPRGGAGVGEPRRHRHATDRCLDGAIDGSDVLEPVRRLSDAELAVAVAALRRLGPIDPFKKLDPYRPIDAEAVPVDYYEPR